MDGIEPEEEFHQEACELLTQLESILLNLDTSTSSNDSDLIDSIFRKLHSLKGAAMMFGWNAMAAFIHQVETTLIPVRNGELLVTAEFIALMLPIIDYIREIFAHPNSVTTNGTALLDAITALTTASACSTIPSIAAIPVNATAMPARGHTLDDWSTIHIAQTSMTDGCMLRVPVAQFHQLTEQVAALLLIHERLTQAMVNEINPIMQSIAVDLKQVATELRDTTMTLRMLPIGILFRRFQRVVHDLARELGKTVVFTVVGEMTTLDKFLIKGLYDPLLHLIRNALDHGIELPHQRIAAGKPPTGRLYLEAARTAEHIVITLADDGRGLDADAIRAKAENYGLFWPGQEVSTTELFNCIFHAGFSTALQVTNISGRGVGLNVVKRAIDELHGAIELKSEPGRGMAVIIKLPHGT